MKVSTSAWAACTAAALGWLETRGASGNRLACNSEAEALLRDAIACTARVSTRSSCTERSLVR